MTTSLCASVPSAGSPGAGACNVGYGMWLLNGHLVLAGTKHVDSLHCSPYGLVLDCSTGEYYVDEQKTAKSVFATNGQPTVNQTMASSSVYNSTQLDQAFANPFCSDALLIVNHEFGFSLRTSESDKWTLNGDVSCTGSGVTLLIGGTSIQATLDGRDGTALTTVSTLVGRSAQHTYQMVYIVPAGSTATISQLCRVESLTIGAGGNRKVDLFSNAMKMTMFVRKT